MQPFPVTRIAHIQEQSTAGGWLIEPLWAEQAVGFIAGAPKSGKTWLALELAVAVAGGRPCLGRYPVHQQGSVLLYAAEDTAEAVKQRGCSIAEVRGVMDVERLAVGLITEPALRLDLPEHQQRLCDTIEKTRPRLLILDPLVRLHRCDENSAGDVSALLDFLRQIQRQHGVAIILVHHLRKSPAGQPGQTLRGSGDLHAWADSSLYLLRRSGGLQLHVEHRARPSPKPVPIELQTDPQPHLCVDADLGAPTDSLAERILEVLAQQGMTRTALRNELGVRNERLGAAITALESQGRVQRHDRLLIVPVPHL